MAPSFFADSFRTLWHAMTSNDRHATHDSPYRTGQHVPLAQSRHAPLTSVATSALESRTDLHSPSQSELADPMRQANGRASPNPYSPGMRSAQRRQSPQRPLQRQSGDKSPMTEIQMQNFAEGLPPPPPVTHSWKRIDRWLEDNYGELYDNLCEGCTQNDVNELEHELDCTLPVEVRESLQVHDGQERGGRPTGVVFGCMLLDCEEIVEEWQNWRAVNEQYLAAQPHFQTPKIPPKALAGPSSSSAPTVPVAQARPSSGIWKDELLGRQESQPPNAVQKVYAHPSWIPLARDWGGNCIAVDLAPGPTGKWGQIILFGRDYDCKFVIARSWSSFLAQLADDFGESDKVVVDEESGDLKFRPFKKQGVEPPYLEILRWRCDQRYGRRPPRKRPGGGLRINSNVGPGFDMSSGSPYSSPTSASERGRSPVFSGKAPVTSSPIRPHVSSPLARVAEENSLRLKTKFDNDMGKGSSTVRSVDKLISVDSPRASGDFPLPSSSSGFPITGLNKENVPASNRLGTEAANVNESVGEGDAVAGSEMKTVAI